MAEIPLQKIDDYRWEIPKTYKPGMRVPGIIYADEKMLKQISADNAPEQVANVAFLPGIVKYSIAMPDIHWGYGFCLTRDTNILTNLGFYKQIADFEGDWSKQNLKNIDLNSLKPVETSILRFLKLVPKKVFRIVTKAGHEIKATDDHPLFTPLGMKSVKDLTSSDKVAIFPFQGIPYEEPSSETIITENDIRRVSLKSAKRLEIIVKKLKERDLLYLTYDHLKLPYILKIMGFIFGDGSMNFIGKKGDGVLHFSGKPEDLEEVRKDLLRIGYTPSPVHHQKVRSSVDKRRYHDCHSFLVNASSLVVLLEALGVPRGAKVSQAYRIPKWIFQMPLWQRRLFLASLFGCELRMPHRRLERRGYFNAPVFPMAKQEELVENGIDFLNDISRLLEEFGVATIYIDKRRRHVSKKGLVTWALELLISPRPENLFNLWSKIGFEYNTKRSFVANVAVQYLKLKLNILKEKEEAINVTIPRLLKEHLSYNRIALQLAGNPLTKRFITDVCYELNRGKKIIPRISSNFPFFEDYIKEATKGLGESGMVWDKIERIEEVVYSDLVYDFTVSHPDHNFIANNFVVSNCIGGVAAMDPEAGGVISPGGIGYDINCLLPDALLNLENGYRMTIKELESKWKNGKVICNDFISGEEEPANIVNFIKRKANNDVFKLTTESGDEITATSDHPFWTPDGMIPLGKLREGDTLAISPFKGVQYEEPSSEIIIGKADVKDLLLSLGKDSRGHGLEQIINYLEKRRLLPLKYNSPQLPYILKIMGFLFGDGTVRFNKGCGKGVSWFYGKREDLEDIRKDVEEIEFKPSRIYSRKRMHKIDTMYNHFEFSRVEESFNVNSSSFAILMTALGVPLGNKVGKTYSLPKWINGCPLWQKRLFLTSLFGAEMSSPKSLYKYNFHAPCLSMNKKEGLLENGISFLGDLKDLLKEFEIECQDIGVRKENIGKDGKISYRLRLIISSKDENLIKFYTRVGFEYNNLKKRKANIVSQYLKLKQKIIRERRDVGNQAALMYSKGVSSKEIFSTLESQYVNKRFLERSIYEGRDESPRIAFNFPSFIEYKESATMELKDNHYVWDKIEKVEKVDYSGYVYDITVNHPSHNFIANNFVVSNCGVRLVRTDLKLEDVQPKLDQLVHALFRDIPCGVGEKGEIRVSAEELKKIATQGSKWTVSHGYGEQEDIEFTEEHGCLDSADPSTLSNRAVERGLAQSGTLGSGNHFLEVQLVEEIYEPNVADVFGLFKGQITVMIHSGSRGFGYQVCDDSLKYMGPAPAKYGFSIPDRQLACAPINSQEGRRYFAEMSCAANYAWANRQALMHLARHVFEHAFGKGYKALGMRLVYDVAHNIGKFEEYEVEGKKKRLFIHRKGATRAFPANHPAIPKAYKDVGQPVIVPGDMGRNSYVMVGTQKAMDETFGSVCHGAGRLMSRSKAIRELNYHTLMQQLKEKGIVVMARGKEGLLEEAPSAYKDVNDVVRVVHNSGIARMVARMRPLGVIKG